MSVPATVKPNKQPYRKINLSKALKMRVERGMSYQDIATHFGMRKSSVFEALKPILNLIQNPEVSKAYQNSRSLVLNNLECTLAAELSNPEKLKAASLNNVAYSFQAVTNARRLEQGQSTENIQYADVSSALEKAKQEREELLQELHNLEEED